MLEYTVGSWTLNGVNSPIVITIIAIAAGVIISAVGAFVKVIVSLTELRAVIVDVQRDVTILMNDREAIVHHALIQSQTSTVNAAPVQARQS